MSALNSMMLMPQSSAVVRPNPRRQKLLLLIGVICVHVVMLWLLCLGITRTKEQTITPPTIQGVMIMPEQTLATPTTLPQPVAKPVVRQATPVATLPPVTRAPPSEKAITQPDVPPVIAPPTVEPKLVQAEPAPVTQPVLPQKSTSEAVMPPRVDATQLNNPAPVYPAMSRRLREEGRVVLDVYILANGHVGELRVQQSSGVKRLDDAALQAVKQWQYVPAHRGSEAINFWYVQPISFSLSQ